MAFHSKIHGYGPVHMHSSVMLYLTKATLGEPWHRVEDRGPGGCVPGGMAGPGMGGGKQINDPRIELYPLSLSSG